MDYAFAHLEEQARFLSKLVKENIIDDSTAKKLALKKKNYFYAFRRSNIIADFLLEYIFFEVNFSRELTSKGTFYFYFSLQ